MKKSKKISNLIMLIFAMILISSCGNGNNSNNSNNNNSQLNLSSTSLGASQGILLPYVQLNVDELDRFNLDKGQAAYDETNPLNQLLSYFPMVNGESNITFSFSGDNYLQNLLQWNTKQYQGSQLVASMPLTMESFNFIKANDTNCTILDNDANKLVCNLTIQASGEIVSGYSSTGTLPIILYAGLRAYSIAEMIRDLPAYDLVPARPNRFNQDTKEINLNQPYYMEISATPNDFNATPTKVVDLHNYFYSPDNNEVFTLDASVVNNGESTNCNIVRINGVDSFAMPNSPTCSDSSFSIDSSGNLMAKGPLNSGVYQINVRANESNEVDWQTFYINVGTNNPTLSAWANGSVASVNVMGNFNSIYTYPAGDIIVNTPSFESSYLAYGQDMATINSMVPTHKIQTTLSEIISEQYSYVAPVESNYKISFWQLVPNNNPELQITESGITNNRVQSWSQFVKAMNMVVGGDGSLGSVGVGVTLNFDFDNNPRADFSFYNNTQQRILANSLVNSVLNLERDTGATIDGLSMDLEAGQPSISGAQQFKRIADSLAYHGKWFPFYEFSSAFSPYDIAALGPLGVAAFSTYDAASQRAPETTAMIEPNSGEMPYSNTMQFNQYSNLYNVFFEIAKLGGTCSQLKNPTDQIPNTVSWCGETLNDAVSANSQDFNSNIQYNNPDSFTVKQIFEAFNGKYTPILPVAATSTLWNSLELWRPDFTLKPGYVLTLGSACESVNNTFFANNESNLDNPTSIAYQQLAGCLLSNILIGSVPVQSFSHCGNAANSTVIPYESCILISNIASASINNSGVAIQPTQVDYDSDILSIYKDSISHSVGYSFFALEWPSTNNPLFDKITPNKSVQEPWYAGFNYSQNSSTVAYDPYYNRSNNMQQWESIATLINKYY